MLDRIHVENYKCLRDVTVELGDFTVLIGPNDSGKSSFLSVVRGLGVIARQGGYGAVFQGDHTTANTVWQKDVSRRIAWEISGRAESHPFRYRMEPPTHPSSPEVRESLNWDGKSIFWIQDLPANPPGSGPNRTVLQVQLQGQPQPHSQPPRIGATYLSEYVPNANRALLVALASSIEYRFNPTLLPLASIPAAGITLDENGGNLAAVLDVMQNSADRMAFEAIQKSLHDAVPTLQGFVLPPAQQQQPGAKTIEFILAGGGKPRPSIPASLASSGALLLTAYLTLAHTESANTLLFEEPENGLHPSRLKMVIDILQKMSRGEIGRKRQIIITTHSPLLLNYVDAKDVRVFVRDAEKGTQVVSMEKVADIDRLLKEFSLGELWFLLGEEKLLEGHVQ